MAYATPSELRAWMNLGAKLDVEDPHEDILEQLLDTATENIDGHCGRSFGPNSEDPEAEVPEAVHTACLMVASRLWDRRQSPGGVLGTNDLGVIRVTGVDRDVEQLLHQHRDIWGVA